MRETTARKRLIAATVALGAFVALLLVLPVALPLDPNVTDLSRALRAPGQDGFLLGSDAVGRDVLLRTLCGGRESVVIGFGVLAVVLALGTVLGAVAGYFGGAVDYLVDKVITAFQAFPSLVLAIAIGGILGQGTLNMVIAIAAVYWTQFARLARGVSATFRSSTCLEAARMCGAPTRAILGKYLFPELAGSLAVMAALSMSDIILTMASLSFIGLGPARPTNEWGTMIAEAQPTFQYAIWCMLVPMAALFVAVILFNLVGDALRDALDARSREAVVQARGSLLLGRRHGKGTVRSGCSRVPRPHETPEGVGSAGNPHDRKETA